MAVNDKKSERIIARVASPVELCARFFMNFFVLVKTRLCFLVFVWSLPLLKNTSLSFVLLCFGLADAPVSAAYRSLRQFSESKKIFL